MVSDAAWSLPRIEALGKRSEPSEISRVLSRDARERGL